LVLAASLVYYVFLSPTLALGVGIYAAVSYWLVLGVERAGWVVWQVALVLFILAWAGQFWGHKIEGKKPSFLKDIQFLMIGPAWLLSFIYKRVGIPV
jgi:uncharacterized membrane protein YGL010W